MQRDMTLYLIPENLAGNVRPILSSIVLHVVVLALFGFSIVQHAEFGSDVSAGTIEVNLVQQNFSQPQPKPFVKPEVKTPDSFSEPQVAPVNQAQVQSQGENNPNTGIKPDVQAQPIYLQNPTPTYPDSAKRAGMEGVVLLLVNVDNQGHATKVALQKSCGFSILDDSAAKTVTRWKFRPALLASLPVESTVLIPIRFKLSK